MHRTVGKQVMLTIAAISAAWAQTDLRGLYVCSTGFPLTKPQAAALTAALNVPGADGLVLVMAWDVVEPAMGQYDWSAFDQWMGMANSLGKRVEISIPAHYHTPAWLFQPAPGGGGAKPLFFSFPRRAADTTCLSGNFAAPWDPAFLAQWDAMLAAVSVHLKSTGNYGVVTLLRLTGINRDSDEFYLPNKPATAACSNDAVQIWLQAGYRPSLLMKGWDGIISSFKKSFPDKTFSVAIIDSTYPFPPIAEDGTVITGTIPDQNLPLLTLAAQKLPGQLVIQNNSLYSNDPAQPATIQAAQSLGTMIAFQTNEDITAQGAACGSRSDTTPTLCTAATFLEELETGIYPLGKSNSLRAQYIEVFPLNVNDFPDSTLQAHFELAPPVIGLAANAEGENPAIAPNTWVEIKGAGLALTGDTRVWKGSDFVNNQLPTQLDGVGVTVNGASAYVFYISPSQINVLTSAAAMTGPVQVVVTNKGVASASFTTQAQGLSPSLFVFNGGPYVAATHVNGSYLGPTTLYPGSTTPAKPGETVVLYANGFGPTSTPIVSGALMQSGALSPLPAIRIGGNTAAVQFAGLVSPGLFQFNVVVPSNTPDGDQAIVASYNGVSTQTGTLITVQH